MRRIIICAISAAVAVLAASTHAVETKGSNILFIVSVSSEPAALRPCGAALNAFSEFKHRALFDPCALCTWMLSAGRFGAY